MSTTVLLIVEHEDPKELTGTGIFGCRAPVVERTRSRPDLPLTQAEMEGVWKPWKTARKLEHGGDGMYGTFGKDYERALVMGHGGRVMHESLRRILPHIPGGEAEYILATMVGLLMDPESDDPDGLRDNTLLKLPGQLDVVDLEPETI
tara:strand:+ start:29132 stop:29575 length:444 start_codon:yes stop_codon:yes gene_type:complete